MIEHVFDPAGETAPLSVKADPGRILIGPTNFLDENYVAGVELSPIQAAKLVLVLTKAIEAELSYSEAWEQERMGRRGGDELL